MCGARLALKNFSSMTLVPRKVRSLVFGAHLHCMTPTSTIFGDSCNLQRIATPLTPDQKKKKKLPPH